MGELRLPIPIPLNPPMTFADFKAIGGIPDTMEEAQKNVVNIAIQTLITQLFADHPDIRIVMNQIATIPGAVSLLLFLREKGITSQQLWRLYKGPCKRKTSDLHVLILGFKVGFVLKEDFLIADEAMIQAIVREVKKDAETPV